MFSTGARTEARNLLGPEGEGAKVALTLLGFERGKSAAGQAVAARIEWERMVELARQRGALGDPDIRRRLARAMELAIDILGEESLDREPAPTGTERQ